MYLTSPGYPLPLSHFSASELHGLETKSLPALIAWCGFNRNTSRVVLYSPARLNGGSLRPFATEQGVAQVQYPTSIGPALFSSTPSNRLQCPGHSFTPELAGPFFTTSRPHFPILSNHTGCGLYGISLVPSRVDFDSRSPTFQLFSITTTRLYWIMFSKVSSSQLSR
jgi:hypothetical protein